MVKLRGESMENRYMLSEHSWLVGLVCVSEILNLAIVALT